ncbi:hypothetical protein M3B20_01355 [Corynebacterium sanguinis]|nr:hypothetical protein [Corynebacterium sanguinis]MCT1804382.1 hypothetical protein [Corynebacterium sanguinis]
MNQISLDVLMADGTEHKDVKAILADQVAYSMTRQRHKWPTMEEDPLLFGSFVAYKALTRLNLFTGSWDEFTQQCAQVSSNLETDDEVF